MINKLKNMKKSIINEEDENIQNLRKSLLLKTTVTNKILNNFCLNITLMGISSIITVLSILLYQKKHCTHNEEHFLCYDTLIDGSN
jgi:hypothetical protein